MSNAIVPGYQGGKEVLLANIPIKVYKWASRFAQLEGQGSKYS